MGATTQGLGGRVPRVSFPKPMVTRNRAVTTPGRVPGRCLDSGLHRSERAMFPQDLIAQAESILDELRARGLRLATAESCTGGLVAGLLTEIAGSSDVVERGFVTYSNAAKHELLGVPEAMLAAHGAVSEPVARAMAEGALAHSSADVAVSVTGVAGPGG